MKKNGFSTIEILVVVVVFTIVYFVGVTSVSYAFNTDENKEKYDDIINIIELQAKSYAENTPDLFTEEDTIYVYVKDLIEANYLVADENGKIINPETPNKDLNDLKIKIEKEGEIIKTNLVKI